MATGIRGRRRRPADDHQLTLSLAWLTEEEFAGALHARGASAVRRVRFKPNRTRMISLSGDRRSLNIHHCFRAATKDVLDAVAAFVRLPSRSSEYRDAIRRMRAWWDGQMHPDDPVLTANARPRACCATPEQREFLQRTYERLNRTRFNSTLPDVVPLRLSNRMSRRFGHVYYATARDGSRMIEEIALNVDLMMEGNEAHLLDTLLHEMSHAEAWLVHGHREHGDEWRAIARRVGCEAKACSLVRIRRRRGQRTPVTRVPRLALSSVAPPAAAAKRGPGAKKAAKPARKTKPAPAKARKSSRKADTKGTTRNATRTRKGSRTAESPRSASPATTSRQKPARRS